LSNGNNGGGEEFLGATEIPVAGDKIIGIGVNGARKKLGILLVAREIELLFAVIRDKEITNLPF
jgi:hypothetical protein